MSISLAEYLRATAITVHGTFFQRLGMRHLGHVDQVGDEGAVRGLTVVVTGPTAGIGRATAAALARNGAHVVLACRSAERGAKLEAALRAEHVAKGLPPPSLEVRLLDLASLSSVRRFCEDFKQSEGGSNAAPRPLHALVNNAGVFNMGVRERRETREGGFEEHMACNHLGHFLLAVLLVPALRQGTKDLEARRRRRRQKGGGGGKGGDDGDSSSSLIPRARVVSVSSAMHHYGASLGRTAEDRADPQLKIRKGLFSADRAYGRSKLAQLLFARELGRRLRGQVDSFGLHPGMVVTDVVRSLPPAVGAAYRALMGRLLLSPDEGARASVFAVAAKEPFFVGGDPSDLWYLDANARPAKPCAAAECPETAEWLWRWSAEAVGLKEGEDVLLAAAK